jgi:hypothetical protein
VRLSCKSLTLSNRAFFVPSELSLSSTFILLDIWSYINTLRLGSFPPQKPTPLLTIPFCSSSPSLPTASGASWMLHNNVSDAGELNLKDSSFNRAPPVSGKLALQCRLMDMSKCGQGYHCQGLGCSSAGEVMAVSKLFTQSTSFLKKLSEPGNCTLILPQLIA